MFSYQQISRWLSFPIDPISVEDWVANREVFGEGKKPGSGTGFSEAEEKELENAWKMEDLLSRVPKGSLVEEKDFLLVVPAGKVGRGEVWVYGEKVEKISLPAGEMRTVMVDKSRVTKLKLQFQGDFQINGKNRLEWAGSGKDRIIFDLL